MKIRIPCSEVTGDVPALTGATIAPGVSRSVGAFVREQRARLRRAVWLSTRSPLVALEVRR